MTCPKYDSENAFNGLKHQCVTEGFLFDNKQEIDKNHAKHYCLTSETFMNSRPKYKDCPYFHK